MIFILIVVGIFLLELKIKNYTETNKKMGEKEEILGGKIILNRHNNKGALLNILSNKPKLIKILSALILAVLSIVFTIVLSKEKKGVLKIGLSLIIGGAASNVYDRFKRGYVVDYFSFKFLRKIIFNISDICIIIGSALLLISELGHKD